jgi:hypothetical protein
MPKRRSSRLALLACALLLALLAADAKVTVHDKGKKKGPARAVKSDVKYIKCQVCEEVAKTLSREASSLRDEKGAKLTESDVLEKVEKVCDPTAEEGEWLVKHDLVEKGTALTMKFMGADVYGKCGVECKTMQRACEDIVSDRDTDIAEALFTSGDAMKRAAVTAFLCRDEYETERGSCLRAPPPTPKDRQKGPAFEATDKKEIDMQRMMKQMEAMGMGGMQMYGRDDMAEMVSDYDDDFAASAAANGEAAGFNAQSFDEDAPAASVAEKAKNAWSSVKQFGRGIADKLKNAVGSDPDDNVELR